VDDADPFEVLNVSVDADEATIERAWKAKLRIVHPDRHPGAAPEVRARLEDRTQELNEAHDVLMDPRRRAEAALAHRRASPSPRTAPSPRTSPSSTASASSSASPSSSASRPAPAGGAGRRPDPDDVRWGLFGRRPRLRARPGPLGVCVECGGRPARPVTFRHTYSLRRWMEVDSVTESLCRSCALAIGRRHQHAVLAKSVLVTVPFVIVPSLPSIVANARALRSVARWPTPTARTRTTLDPGRPVVLRPGAWLPVLVAAALGIALAFGTTSPASPGPPGGEVPTSPSIPPDEFVRLTRATTGGGELVSFDVGDCVLGVDVVQPIVCSQPHSGSVIDVEPRPSMCPTGTNAVVDGPQFVICVELDR
jgi:hypothetical protein